MPEHFHLMRPLWLLALLPLVLLAWRVARPAAGGNAWRRVVDARLLPLMMATEGARRANWRVAVPAAAGWILATLALAGPAWDRRPQPVFQTDAARVVVLALSSSMNDADLKPSRLARARYKIEDVLAQASEGQTALVAYAGDAFTVAPLTRDAGTIRSLLKVLQPDLMPVDGGRADLGLLKAGALLRQAGVANGRVLLIADGVDPSRLADARRAAARLRSAGDIVSVLGVGTADAVPLTDEQGRLVRTAAGAVQAPRLDASALASVAQAGGGRYQSITDDGRGLESLVDAGASGAKASSGRAKATVPAWKDRGPDIVILLLPLAALAFRRNWLVGATLLAVLAAPSQAAMAATWADAWQRPDQQASRALAAGDYARAAALARDPARRGSAEYKRGHYQSALDAFAQASGADADYNRGNALARLGRYQDAIAAYDKAIAESSSNDDAKANKAAVQALLKHKPPGSRDQPPQRQRPSDGSQSNGQNQGASPAGRQGSQAKAPAGQTGKARTGAATPGGTRDGKASTPKPGDAQTGSASQGGGDAQPGAAPGAASARPANDDFAKAAQQVGKRADAKTGDSAGGPPSPSATRAAGASRPSADAVSARAGSGDAQPIEGEEKQAAEQWLRRIPDDPGGLLRRKFLYQYRQRAGQAQAGGD